MESGVVLKFAGGEAGLEDAMSRTIKKEKLGDERELFLRRLAGRTL